MRPVMYTFSDPSMPISTGKRATMNAHAAVEAYKLSLVSPADLPEDRELMQEPRLVQGWYLGGHYTKILLQTNDLQITERYLNDRGFRTALIIDEGRTEFDGLTAAALGVEIVDKDKPHVAATFGEFALYKEPKSYTEADVIAAHDTGSAAGAQLVQNFYRTHEPTRKPWIKRVFREAPGPT